MEREHHLETTGTYWRQFFGANFGYILELYEAYSADKMSVTEDTRAMFEQYGNPNLAAQASTSTSGSSTNAAFSISPDIVAKAIEYVHNIRMYGHLAATTDPIYPAKPAPQLQASTYGIDENVLLQIPATVVWPKAPASVTNALEAVEGLRSVYLDRHGYEFTHITNAQERDWLEQQVESGQMFGSFSTDDRQALYRQLAETELFEKFLHRRFVGQKRFSVEGLDALVPMVDSLATAAVKSGIPNVVIGMAHRGRLNVLAHVLKKPYEKIFSEFHSGNNHASDEEMDAYNNGWGGDVKYHLGWHHTFTAKNGLQARYVLANNPSHLEVVNPVVQGIARAAQEDRRNAGLPKQDVHQAISIVVHGDAAFPGEGVVTETMNFSQIAGFFTGGSVHIIANNHVGFTADPEQGRSTHYSSDPAKGFNIPVVHVSADDPEACIAAIRLAFLYRETFEKDFMIDLIGYRRWGHNETDDPSMTQPLLYNEINAHKTIKELYGDMLIAQGVITEETVQSIDSAIHDELMSALEKVAGMHDQPAVTDFSEPVQAVQPVSLEELRDINRAMLETPTGFSVYPKLRRILDRRTDAIDNGDIDWAHGEALAFGAILRSGTPIRLTGQDSERGTFGQRHLVLHDVDNGQPYTPLQHLPEAKASFVVYNSPLSETGVIGFEYGYNVEAPETLVLWEAQFGDFVNVAQPMIDQFIAAGRAKWGEASGLVLLLPHGFEGQASEHSSARVERFLQLGAKNNLFVTNVTTSAQYFHLLRLQAARLGANSRPLIVMTPKSLLRSAHATSKGTDLVNGQFETVLHVETRKTSKKVTRLILSSGKVGVDLTTELEKGNQDTTWLATARVEQLYPFPQMRMQEILAKYENLQEVVWLQEEPQNAGPWSFMEPRLRALLPAGVRLTYVGRPEQSFVAEGSPDVHNREQAHMIEVAMTPGTHE